MLILQVLINGILIGGLYGCVALGFSLVWGVSNIINLSHGIFIMLGAYITFWLFTLFHIDPFLTIPISAAILFLVGYLIQKFLLNYVVGYTQQSGFGVFLSLILTFGLARVFENLMVGIWSGDWRSVTTTYSGLSLHLAGVSIPYIRIAVFGVALFSAGLLSIFLYRSRAGMAIRAITFNTVGAQIVGIELDRIYNITFALGAALAGIAGSLVSLIYSFSPFLSTPYLSWAFVIVVMGGLGSIYGAIAGGILLGIIESVASVYVGPGYQQAIGFIILVLLLVFRPQGLFGKKFLK
jgi:branched-chain amino acid transport system permease protein